MSEKKERNIWLTIGLILFTCLIIEFGLSFLKYHYVIFGTRKEYSLLEAQTTNQNHLVMHVREGLEWKDNMLHVSKDGGTLIFQGDIEGLHSLRFSTLDTKKDGNVYASMTVSIVENETPRTIHSISTQTFPVMDTQQEVQLLLGDHSDLKVVQITFAKSTDEYLVGNLILNGAELHLFHFGRFLFLFILVLGIYIIGKMRFWELVFDPDDRTHRIAFVSTMVLCLLLVMWTYFALLGPKVKEKIEYPLANVASQQPYVQQFDALKKHRLSLDVEPSPELLALENPYDRGQRDGVSALWDRALYNGKYYSYFGIAPVIFVYYPYYTIFRSVPPAGTVMTLYALAGVAALFGVLYELIRVFKIRVNLVLLLLGSVATVFASGLLLMQRGWSSVYYIATLSGVTSLLIFLYVSLRACRAESKKAASILFALSGFCLLISVASRVSASLIGIALCIPLFIHYLKTESDSDRKLNAFLCFIIPTLIGAALVCIFNFARFGSPFEFGTSYQLTVSDISRNHFSLNRVLPALYHYFLHPVRLTMDFPFVQIMSSKLSDYGYYVYVDSNFGLFSFPLIAVAFFAFLLRHIRRKQMQAGADVSTAGGENVDIRMRHVLYVTGVVTSLFLAILDFSMGGVIWRYTFDFAVVLGIIGLFVLLEAHEGLSVFGEAMQKAAMALAVCVFLVTIFVGFMLLVNQYNGNFVAYPASYWMKLKDFFVFW
ncbi:MAG: hypothetical protein J6T47_01470 [Lachnospiraceae bacterium]|nr:hypothetical protein [Lachnospiraceae bacterium]